MPTALGLEMGYADNGHTVSGLLRSTLLKKRS
jgi:hypothetical protein